MSYIPVMNAPDAPSVTALAAPAILRRAALPVIALGRRASRPILIAALAVLVLAFLGRRP